MKLNLNKFMMVVAIEINLAPKRSRDRNRDKSKNRDRGKGIIKVHFEHQLKNNQITIVTIITNPCNHRLN